MDKKEIDKAKAYLLSKNFKDTEYMTNFIAEQMAEYHLSLLKEVDLDELKISDEDIKNMSLDKCHIKDTSYEGYREGAKYMRDILLPHLQKPVESYAVELLNDLHCQLQNEHLSEFMESLMDRLDQFKQLKK